MYNNGYNPAVVQNSAPKVQNDTNELRVAFARSLNRDIVKAKFKEVLNKNAEGFMSSLLSLVKNNDLLLKADPDTVIAAAMQAATLKLPINQNLGLAYIVPYWNGKAKRNEAQFQMGWKGYVQLAERTGQYKTINASVVYEGQIEEIDFITGNIVKGKRTGNEIVGYVAYIEFLNGFSKTLYMDKAEMEEHARTYSQSYKKGFGVWKDNFNAMALKTVTKQLISKYGIMSIEMESSNLARAIAADQAVINEDNSLSYVDNDQTIEAEPMPVNEPPADFSFDSLPRAEAKQEQPKQSKPQPSPQPAQQGSEEPLF